MICHFCEATGARLNANHWTGDEYVRVDVCEASACRESLARRPRRPRQQPRQPVILDAGGWAMVPSLNRMMAGKGQR